MLSSRCTRRIFEWRIHRSQQASASLTTMIRLYVKMATSDRGLIEREKSALTGAPASHPYSLKEGVHRAGQKIISSTKIPRKDGDPIKKGCRRMPRTVWAFILRHAAGNNSSQKFPSRRETAIHVTALSVPTVVLFINGRLFCFSTVFPRSSLYLANGLFLTWRDEEQPRTPATATVANDANENYRVFFPAKRIPANSSTTFLWVCEAWQACTINTYRYSSCSSAMQLLIWRGYVSRSS